MIGLMIHRRQVATVARVEEATALGGGGEGCGGEGGGEGGGGGDGGGGEGGGGERLRL